jgi:hypothetical protein
MPVTASEVGGHFQHVNHEPMPTLNVIPLTECFQQTIQVPLVSRFSALRITGVGAPLHAGVRAHSIWTGLPGKGSAHRHRFCWSAPDASELPMPKPGT